MCTDVPGQYTYICVRTGNIQLSCPLPMPTTSILTVDPLRLTIYSLMPVLCDRGVQYRAPHTKVKFSHNYLFIDILFNIDLIKLIYGMYLLV